MELDGTAAVVGIKLVEILLPWQRNCLPGFLIYEKTWLGLIMYLCNIYVHEKKAAMCITYLMSTMGVVSIHQTKSCCISSSSSPIFGPKLGCTIPAAKTWKSSGWTRSKPLRSCGAFPCVSRTRALGLIRLLSNISRAYSVLISWPETKGAEDFFFYAVCPYALVVKIHGFLAHVDPFFWGSMDLWLDFLDHAPLRDELDRRLVFSYEKQPLCHCPRLVPNVWNGRMGWLLLVISSDI